MTIRAIFVCMLLCISSFLVSSCAALFIAEGGSGVLEDVLTNQDGAPFDNVLVLLSPSLYQKIDWKDSYVSITNIPPREYHLRVYIVDSVRGSYFFEQEQFLIHEHKKTRLPTFVFQSENKRNGMIIPNEYPTREKRAEIAPFPFDDAEVYAIADNEGVLGFFGTSSWRGSIDYLAKILVDQYAQEKRFNRYVLVEGFAQPTEAGADAKALYTLSVNRAKSVVQYITENYRIEREHFIVVGNGAHRLKKPGQPEDAANRRVVLHYDAEY